MQVPSKVSSFSSTIRLEGMASRVFNFLPTVLSSNGISRMVLPHTHRYMYESSICYDKNNRVSAVLNQISRSSHFLHSQISAQRSVKEHLQ